MNKLFCDAMVYVPRESLLLKAKFAEVSLCVAGAALLKIAPTAEQFLSLPLDDRSRKMLTVRIRRNVCNPKIDAECTINDLKPLGGASVNANLKEPSGIAIAQERVTYPTAAYGPLLVGTDCEFHILSPVYGMKPSNVITNGMAFGVVGDERAE